MEERIKAMYNDCWAIYKQYLSNHDMTLYNKNVEKLMNKYGCQSDISSLLFWWAGRVQGIHDEYMRKSNETGR